MDNHYADPAAQNWSHNKSPKRENDEKLYALIESFVPTNKRTHILTFPAAGWCFESGLSKQIIKPFSFTGIEKDDIVFSKASSKILRLQKVFPENWYSMHNATSREFFEHTTTRYDIIYLDWMGTWSKDKRNELMTIFKRRVLNRHALLMFTIWECRGNGPEMNVLDKLARRSTINFPFEKHVNAKMTPNMLRKTYGVAERVVHLARDEGYKASLAHFSEYRGNGNHPQLTFAFELKTKSA